MPFEGQIFVSSEPAPRRWLVLLSAVAHVLALVLLMALRHAAPYIVPPTYETAEVIPATKHVTFNAAWAKAAPLRAAKSVARKSRSRLRLIAPETEHVAEGAAVKALRKNAAARPRG